MGIPPFQNTRLTKTDQPDARKLEELFEAQTRNIEDIYNSFQTQQAAQESGNAFLRLAVAGKHKIAYGRGAVTFTAEVFSAQKGVTHGLGSAPLAVLITGENPNISYGCTARAATTFNAQGFAPGGALTGSFNFDWVAIA